MPGEGVVEVRLGQFGQDLIRPVQQVMRIDVGGACRRDLPSPGRRTATGEQPFDACVDAQLVEAADVSFVGIAAIVWAHGPA